MKPRNFQTAKAARRYLRRFKWQFLANHRSDAALAGAMIRAFRRVAT